MNIKEKINSIGRDIPAMDYYISMEGALGSPDNVKGLKEYLSDLLELPTDQFTTSWERSYSGVYGIIIKYKNEQATLYLNQEEISQFDNLKQFVYFKNDYTKQAKKMIDLSTSNVLVLTPKGENEFIKYIKEAFPNFPDIQVLLKTELDRTYAYINYFNSNFRLGFQLKRTDLNLNCIVSIYDTNVLNYRDRKEMEDNKKFLSNYADIVIFK